MEAKDRILVALDTNDVGKLVHWAKTLGSHVGGFKIGLEALLSIGLKPALNAIRGYGPATDNVFIDAKIHDIPQTMLNSVRAVVEHPQVKFVNVHASAGLEGMRASAAVKGGAKLLAVTVLTSHTPEACEDIFGAMTEKRVGRFASQAREAGCDGVVCSPEDLHELRKPYLRESCRGLLYVTPGVRPKWSAKNDQERVTTPAEAIRLGADYLVIGRPITAPPERIGSPVSAAQLIADEIAAELFAHRDG